MKAFTLGCAVLILACGVAVAKDAKRRTTMSDAEMDAVTAGDISISLPGFIPFYIKTPTYNTQTTNTQPIVFSLNNQPVVTITNENGKGLIGIGPIPNLDQAMLAVLH